MISLSKISKNFFVENNGEGSKEQAVVIGGLEAFRARYPEILEMERAAAVAAEAAADSADTVTDGGSLFTAVDFAEAAAEPLFAAEIINEQAEKILEDARAEAEQILSQARLDADALLEEVRENGYKTGHEAGYEQARMQAQAQNGELYDKIFSECTQFIKALDGKQDQMLNDFEEQVHLLAVEIAGRILGMELDKSNYAFLSLFKKIAADVGRVEWIKLTVGQHEASLATKNAAELVEIARNVKHVDIIVDRDAPAGTCIVDTPSGIVDASIDTQLARSAEIIRDVRALTRDRGTEE